MRKALLLGVIPVLTAAACGLGTTGVEPSIKPVEIDAGVIPLDGAKPATTDGAVVNDARAEDVSTPVGDAAADAPSAPCASCTFPTTRSLCVSGTCESTFRVFISSDQSTANLGGTVGADARCQRLAIVANLGGNWRAWVSTSQSTPSARFQRATVAYRLLNGTVVANDWTDLVSGGIRTTISVDERGASLQGPSEVWTGTTTAGTSNPGCTDFTYGDDTPNSVLVGVSDQRSGLWTSLYQQSCNRTDPRIYCFEQ